jgi:hypothetical protein
MRKIITIAGLAAALTAASIPMAAASGTPNARSQAEKQCRSELRNMGRQLFNASYGTNRNKSNGFGRCVSHRTTQNTTAENQAQENASQQCRDEQSTNQDFATTYGTPPQYRDAFGKCVSQKAKAQSQETEQSEVQAEENAARQCRAERKPDPDAFAHQYGTARTHYRNAFGRCVSQKAKAQEQQQQQAAQQA